MILVWLLACAKPACVGHQCTTNKGEYYLHAPDGSGPFPLLLHLHGFNGSAKRDAEQNLPLIEMANTRGIAVAFVGGEDGGWNHNQRPELRDDVAFLASVVEAVDLEIGVLPTKVAVAGHSLGGTMSWTLACEAPRGFSAFYASSAGPFRPLQAQCSGAAVSMMHTHGTADAQSVLDERTTDAISFLAQEGQCEAARFVAEGALSCEVYEGCTNDHVVKLCTHGGGHKDAPGWQGRLLDFIEASWR